MPDLKTAKADCETAEAFLKRFGVPNYRGKDGNDDFNLTNDPKLRDVNQAKRKLLQFIKDHKDEPILIVYVLSCHGIMQDGH